MRAFVGTSGYSYKEWKGAFYPEDLPADRMLAYYAERFPSVEINNTFYRMPTEKAVSAWADAAPEGFRFVLKASRRITHQKRLVGAGEEIGYFLDTVAGLGDKLGPLLFQFSPFFRKNAKRLGAFLDRAGGERRIALEFRHASWEDDEIREVAREHGAALCFTDDGKEPAGDRALVPTARFGYVRLRDDRYDEAALDRFAARIREQPWDEVYVFFKHEDEGKGPDFARSFLEKWRDRG